jgi:hypothetical protein
VAIDGDGGNGGGQQQHKNSNAISFLPPSTPNHITMHATNDNQQQTNKQTINFLHVKRRKRIKQHARGVCFVCCPGSIEFPQPSGT